MRFRIVILALSFLMLNLVGCDDKDYSDDIDALKKELEETKASIKTLQDLTNALQNQLFIDSYEKTDDGYTLKMSDGSKITVTQGKKGEDGTDAPAITEIKETEDAMEFIFSNGNTITLPKNEKYDVITLDIEVTEINRQFEFSFTISDSDYFGYGPLFSFPENLEINWGDGWMTGNCRHKYKKAGNYTVTIKAKQIYGLKPEYVEKIKSMDISQCSNIKYLDLSYCEGNVTLRNLKNLIEIEGNSNNDITELNLENLPNLRAVRIGSFYTEKSPLKGVNFTNCPKVEILDISSTMLTTIDISGLTNLYDFRCCNTMATIGVWEGFDVTNYSDWSVPEGVKYEVKK